jgi:hypothetical protein
MKKYLLLWSIPFIFFKAHAQLGVTVASDLNFTPDWQVVAENYVAHRHWDFFRHGASLTLDYIFPSKTRTFRVQPGLHLLSAAAVYYHHSFDVFGAGLQGNLAVQPFPVEKGKIRHPGNLWIQFSPGLTFLRKKYLRPSGDDAPFHERFTHQSIAPNLGFNLLLEFQLTELLTIAPLAGIRFFPGVAWQNFTEIVSSGKMEDGFDRTTWRQYSFGLRMGLEVTGNRQ